MTSLRVLGWMLVLALPVLPLSLSSPQAVPFYQPPSQILIEAQVRPKGHKKVRPPWVGAWYSRPDQKGQADRILGELPNPVLGLGSDDFHVFDNEVEQSINYFRAPDKPADDLTSGWSFVATPDATWGTAVSGPHFDFLPASYVVGYVPPTASPGECHTIKLIVNGRDVDLNRDEYCAPSSSVSNDSSSQPKPTIFPKPTNPWVKPIDVSIRTFTFWSSGVLRIGPRMIQGGSPPEQPTAEYSYAIQANASEAPATVHLDVDFGGGAWDFPCRKDDRPIEVLATVQTSDGRVAVQRTYSYRCLMTPQWSIIYAGEDHSIHVPQSYVLVPSRLDTEIRLPPGDYDLEVAVSGGYDSGHTQIALHVEAFDPHRLMISDVVIGDVVRSAEWVVRDAASVAPAPIVPTPLVSKNLEYFPDSQPASQTGRGTPLYLYFEIYEPQHEAQPSAVYYQWRVVDQKTGSTVMSPQPRNAADFVVPGSSVIPIGLSIDTDKLQSGAYRLQMQASDSAGHKSEWREAKFNIQ